MQKINPVQTFAWNALEQHKADTLNIPQLFSEDSSRFDKYSLRFENELLVDFSKNAINEKTLTLLRQLANECGLESAKNAMFSGKKINRTENRPFYMSLFVTAQTPLLLLMAKM